MKELLWFRPIPKPRAASASPVISSVVVGVAGGCLLFLRGHRLIASVVWAATALVGLTFVVPTLRKPILIATHWVGAVAGRIATLAVLWPFYVLVFGSIRLFLSAARVDLLGLRLHPEWPSYWRPSAPEQKRAKYYHRLFTVEAPRQGSHALAWAIGILVFVMVLAGSSELILRAMGFGNPIVYRVDPRVGYYPAPDQDVHRYGGRIHINGFGMRSRDVTAVKAADTFRILMLGDSTLYGGSYIDQSELYSSRLEGLLNQTLSVLPDSPRQVEVLCMGVNAWGPQHELAYMKEFGILQADLVMVMGPPDDAYRARYGITQLPFYAEGHGPEFAWQEFWDHLMWEHNLRRSGAAQRSKTSRRAGEVLDEGVCAWLEIAKLAQTRGAHVDFEFLPNEEEARKGGASASTQRVLDALLPELIRKKVPHAFPLQLFQSTLRTARPYHDGVHLSPSGHRIYAGYLRDRILQLASVP
ncbi:MAG: hypothetical protein ACLQVL_12125 [Terriglobia bacterium]